MSYFLTIPAVSPPCFHIMAVASQEPGETPLGSSPQIYTVRVSVTSQKEYFFPLRYVKTEMKNKNEIYMPQ